jgi:hypothetical protein
MLAASFGCTLSVSRLLQHAKVKVEYSVETTELLWGSLPVTKKWSALDICQPKGFRHVEQILSSFSPNEPSNYRESPPSGESRRRLNRGRNVVGDRPSRVDYTATPESPNSLATLSYNMETVSRPGVASYDHLASILASYLTSLTDSIEETKAPSDPAEPTYLKPWGEWEWDKTWTNDNECRSRQIADITDPGMLYYLFMILTLRLKTHFCCRVF